MIELLVEEIPSVQDSSHVRIRFTVKDTGIGMPEEFLEHVFEPFARSRLVGEVEGTGLGLSITKGLVDLMGGQITVSSSPGQGTCFCVELEFEPGAPAFGSGEKDEEGVKLRREAALEGTKFLVVEDNVLNSEILCELLKLCGAQTETQTDGILGVQAFSGHAPGTYDAILMDIQMPRMNGYEASRAIRALDREDAKTIPIVAMTANAFTEDILASKEAGMDAHVAKPVDVKVLWGTLLQVLENKR